MYAPRKDALLVSNPERSWKDVPGIVIRDWTPERRSDDGPRVRAFVYGESVPSLPTLPFGRWKSVA
ncbi:MAG: hypothetical protein EA350_01145 [Gemmatimonadales bacterium]|nr:MAG: hypothetical protein EA350_01145 [Gemmatimonadales bacterium]